VKASQTFAWWIFSVKAIANFCADQNRCEGKKESKIKLFAHHRHRYGACLVRVKLWVTER
jgi:hypothetical protein